MTARSLESPLFITRKREFIRPVTVNSNKRNIQKSVEVCKPLTSYERVETPEEHTMRISRFFDRFILDLMCCPFHEAFENFLKMVFTCKKAYFWISKPSEKGVYSPTLNLFSNYSSIPGFVKLTHSIITISKSSPAPFGYKPDLKICSSTSSQLIFEISSRTDNDDISGLAHIIRDQSEPMFSGQNTKDAFYIIQKFNCYSSSIGWNYRLKEAALNLFNTETAKTGPGNELTKLFNSETAEVWHLDLSRGYSEVFEPMVQGMAPVSSSYPGIVRGAVSRQQIINEINALDSVFYSPEVDGEVKGPVLIAPFGATRKEGRAVAIRGRSKIFNGIDAFRLKSITPIAVRSVLGFRESESKSLLTNQFSDLVQLSCQVASTLSPQELVARIEKNARFLCECEKGCLFLSDKKEMLRGNLNGNHKVVKKGLAWKIFLSKKLLNIIDIQKAEDFSPDDDCPEGFKARSALGAPLMSVNGHLVGVLIIYNKINGRPFDDTDERIFSAFCAFVGPAIANAGSYCSTIKLSKQLRVLIDSLRFGNNVSFNFVKLIERMRKIANCSRITLFAVDERNNDIKVVANIGSANHFGNIFAKQAIIQRKRLSFNSDDLCDIDTEGQSESGRILMNGDLKSSRISSIFTMDILDLASTIEREEITVVPLMFGNTVVGALEVVHQSDATSLDTSLFETIANITSVSFDQMEIPAIATFGCSSVELKPSEWGAGDEYRVPNHLRIDLKIIHKIDFDAQTFDGIRLYQVVFSLFGHFHIIDELSIEPKALFNLLTELRSKSTNDYFGSFFHAIDCLQLSAWIIRASRFDEYIEKKYLLGLFLAVLFCGTGRKFLGQETPSTQYIRKSLQQKLFSEQSTSFGILLKTVSSTKLLLNNEDETRSAIFKAARSSIFSTNYSRLPQEVADLSELVATGEFDPEDFREHKMLLLGHIARCADLGCLARETAVYERNARELARRLRADGCTDKNALLGVFGVMAKISPAVKILEERSEQNALILPRL